MEIATEYKTVPFAIKNGVPILIRAIGLDGKPYELFVTLAVFRVAHNPTVGAAEQFVIESRVVFQAHPVVEPVAAPEIGTLQ